jgi:hypothetical protein
MVKEIILFDDISASLEYIFQNLLNSQFELHHHSLLGNTGVTITEWIESRENFFQRICFFTLVDKASDLNINIVENQECIKTEVTWI